MPAGTSLRQADPIAAIPPLVPDLVGRAFTVFGTFGALLITRPPALEAAYRMLARQLAAIDKACSRFRADSELSAANRAAGREISISPLFAEFLAAALQAAELSDGDVDPTCGAALIQLGYDRDFSKIGVAADRPEVPAGGWQRVSLDTRRGTLRTPPNVLLDLGATAKALAADRAAAAIAAATGAGVLVNLGGDIAVAGPPPKSGWPVEIALDPQRVRRSSPASVRGPVISIKDGGVATSGTRSRSWRRGTRIAHHIVVPGTGKPAASCWIAATVAAASCVDANTAATAAIIRSERAPAWLSGLHVPARLVRADGSVLTTGGWPT